MFFSTSYSFSKKTLFLHSHYALVEVFSLDFPADGCLSTTFPCDFFGCQGLLKLLQLHFDWTVTVTGVSGCVPSSITLLSVCLNENKDGYLAASWSCRLKMLCLAQWGET